jgi:hypothetical protein
VIEWYFIEKWRIVGFLHDHGEILLTSIEIESRHGMFAEATARLLSG